MGRKIHQTKPRGSDRAANLRHGESDRSGTQRPSPEYRAWCCMISRCCVPGVGAYERYGAVGVTVCDEWRHSYERFLEDMGRKPSPTHSLDRIDGARGYSPDNCRWATWAEQARNKRSNHLITHAGTTKTMTDWALEAGISVQLLYYRLKHGWDIGRALASPPRTRAA